VWAWKEAALVWRPALSITPGAPRRGHPRGNASVRRVSATVSGQHSADTPAPFSRIGHLEGRPTTAENGLAICRFPDGRRGRFSVRYSHKRGYVIEPGFPLTGTDRGTCAERPGTPPGRATLRFRHIHHAHCVSPEACRILRKPSSCAAVPKHCQPGSLCVNSSGTIPGERQSGGHNLHIQAHELIAQLSAAVGGTLAAAVVLTAALVWIRRMTGAVVEPLAAPVLVAAGIGIVLVLIAIRLAGMRSATWPTVGWARWGSEFGLSLAGCAAVGSLMVPGSSTVAAVTVWLLLAGEEWAYWLWRSRRPSKRRETLPARKSSRASAGTERPLPLPQAVPSDDRFSLPQPRPGAIAQRLNRAVAPDGTDTLEGWLRYCMPAGQRAANLHVAFCPPFSSQPEMLVQQLEGPPVRIKTAQLLTYGARIEIKMRQPPDQPADVLLRILVRLEQPGIAPTGTTTGAG